MNNVVQNKDLDGPDRFASRTIKGGGKEVGK